MKLVDALKTVRTADGIAVFEDVYDRHERHGRNVANEASAPDIIVRPNQMDWKITDVIREPVFDTTDEFSHTYEGLFIAAGPPIEPSVNISPQVIDIAPTILELFGYRPAPVMDGNSLSKLHDVDQERLSEVPDPNSRTYLSKKEQGSSGTVTDRLEQLGYLE
jgi:predicted AlkP superfamily phosphohydrolase/phosphomutase